MCNSYAARGAIKLVQAMYYSLNVLGLYFCLFTYFYTEIVLASPVVIKKQNRSTLALLNRWYLKSKLDP